MSIKQIRHRIVSACDGACSGNGTDNSPGGWGVAISYGNDIVKLSGYKARTTNNEMELTAMLEALRKIKTLPEVKESSVEIYSDSAYVVGCFEEKWYINWEKNGWINSQKQPVKNRALWEQLIAEYRGALQNFGELHIRKIKGHISSSEAAKWLQKYNQKYGLNMTEQEFENAVKLNREADAIATDAYKNIREDAAAKSETTSEATSEKPSAAICKAVSGTISLAAYEPSDIAEKNEQRLYIIIPAGGSGQRFGEIKQFADIAGTPLLLLTLRNIIKSYSVGNFGPQLAKIVVAMHAEHIPRAEQLLSEFGGMTEIVCGGDSRGASVAAAFERITVLANDADLLAVHDGCRPFVPTNVWARLLKELCDSEIAIPVLPITDTIKSKSSLQNFPREDYIAVQTPQIMTLKAARSIYSHPHISDEKITDDSTLALNLGHQIGCAEGSSTNIKITTKTDALIAAAIAKTEWNV